MVRRHGEQAAHALGGWAEAGEESSSGRGHNVCITQSVFEKSPNLASEREFYKE